MRLFRKPLLQPAIATAQTEYLKMIMSTDIARMRISRELREAERLLDEALLKQSGLMSTLIETRRETGSEPFLGQTSLLRLAKYQQTLVSAGGELARVHGDLLRVQELVVGIESCPPDAPMRRTGEIKAA